MTKFSKQQEYLLSRIPRWNTPEMEEIPEPPTVRKARSLVEAFEAKRSERRKEFKARAEKLIKEAREAIYFKPAEEALKVVQKLEKELGL